MIKKWDKNNFFSMFDPKTGFYMRSGIFENGKDTGKDPFMASFPELIDIGIMGHCNHGKRGLCVKGGVECYQGGFKTHLPNMTFENFKRIVDECKGKTYQFALGGRGDVDEHENFEEMLKYCRENGIVPNFTTSGFNMTPQKAAICKSFVGAVAVSWYRQQHSLDAIQMLLDAGVKTNIHYVLGKNTIDEAICRLKAKDFPAGINAVIFLLHKPVGQGTEENVLTHSDERLKVFFGLIDKMDYSFKVGFDSCSVPAILNFTQNINRDSIDTCEGARWSMYVTADMIALPCSFDNQGKRWGYNIAKESIENAWNSPQFEDFRQNFKNACPDCKEQAHCMGGCPIVSQIVLCDRKII